MCMRTKQKTQMVRTMKIDSTMSQIRTPNRKLSVRKFDDSETINKSVVIEEYHGRRVHFQIKAFIKVHH